MLSLVLLLASLFETPKPALPSPLHVACPATPAAFTVMPVARTCPALEVSGRIDASGLQLDPAYEVDIAPAELARPGRGDAVLAGYGSDGRTIFAHSFGATGAFHLYVPLSHLQAQSVQRLRLIFGSAATEVAATSHRDAEAETLSLDAGHYLIAWNAREFPSLRVNAPNVAPIVLGGTSTYEQRTIDSTARNVVLEFSDGVHSMSKTYRIFGR